MTTTILALIAAGILARAWLQRLQAEARERWLRIDEYRDGAT